MSDQIKTAIVTGSARGIGAAVAKRLAKDGFGVAVVDLDEAALLISNQRKTSSRRHIRLGA